MTVPDPNRRDPHRPDRDRGDELIQKYFEGLASDSELAELERLLTTSPAVASAFAETARLHAGLQRHFQRQYKIDQVASLLQAAESESPATNRPPSPEPVRSARPEGPAGGTPPARSTFVPVYTHRAETSRRRRLAAIRVSKVIAALLLVAVGVAVWISERTHSAPLRLISGRVSVAGREVAAIPVSLIFKVVGHDQAVIELPGGALVKLAPATRATIHRRADRAVLELKTGGGDFVVQPDQPAIRIETEVGVVTTASGQFSLDLMTAPVSPISPSISMPLPSLAVVVAEGSVTVEQRGRPTILSRGEQRVFSNAG